MQTARSHLTSYSRFQNSFVDFDHGIRVGHLDPEARITQIMKAILIERHGIDMVCDRWGRGIYWQWICWVPKPNRAAKPASSNFNFASAKFFVSVDREERAFQTGMQIERAPKVASRDPSAVLLDKDWDWHVLLKSLAEQPFARGVQRLLREGFKVRVGAFSSLFQYNSKNWDAAECRRRAGRFSPHEWGGFQLFWSMNEKEVRQASGPEIVQAAAAVFDEVSPIMNRCMYKPCLKT